MGERVMVRVVKITCRSTFFNCAQMAKLPCFYLGHYNIVLQIYYPGPTYILQLHQLILSKCQYLNYFLTIILF